jgi:hypothetical protein
MDSITINVPALEFTECKDGWVETIITLNSSQTGYFEDGVGGPTAATLIDIAVVEAIRIQKGVFGPTYAFDHRIKKSIPVGTEIVIRAKVIGWRHTVYSAKVEIRSLAGEIFAYGKGSLKVTQKPQKKTDEYIMLKKHD